MAAALLVAICTCKAAAAGEVMPGTIPFASCTASSETPGFYCEEAFDVRDSKAPNVEWAVHNDPAIGSWLETRFAKASLVTKFEFKQRKTRVSRSKGVTLSFSDGSSQKFPLLNNDLIQSFTVVPAVPTKFVRLTLTSFYTDWKNNGARFIRFSGFPGITQGTC